MLFAGQVLTLLRAIRCQTSTEYPKLRYGQPEKHSAFDYAGEGGLLYNLSSSLLAWEDDSTSCSAVSMGRPDKGTGIPYGSFSLLWPFFVRICLGHFVETLSCALQGKTVSTEAGMSIFEHSLAFAEAESVISQSIGLGLLGFPKSTGKTEGSNTSSSGSAAKMLTRSQVLERLNVTPELLLIALISCCNSLTSNVLDVFGRQSHYRLINTAVWGLCFMSAMIWKFVDSSSSVLGDEPAVFKFPTVCLVGFVPHLLIMFGILICLSIYGMALLFTAFSLPDAEGTSFREALSLARENMQSSSQIHSLNFNRHEDFYTALVRLGYACLTAASEAVFLNEGKPVFSRSMTWLEEDRLSEMMSSRDTQRFQGRAQPLRILTEAEEDFNTFKHPQQLDHWETGYGVEKKLEKRAGAQSTKPESSFGGVGAFSGPTRAYLGFAFFRSIFFLIAGWLAFGVSRLLECVGIATPHWLAILAGNSGKGHGNGDANESRLLDFWILTDEGELRLPQDYEFDVEKEMRKREIMNTDRWGNREERWFEGKLYNWWKAGGSWGNKDASGDYSPAEDDWDDTTSVVSTSTNEDSEWESYGSDGRRTPTQGDPHPSKDRHSRSGTPAHETVLDASSLARLLDPKDKESKQEAHILASHLQAEDEGKIMTRSQFRTQMERERARILTSSRLVRFRPGDGISSLEQGERKRPTPDEEAEMLENLIISKRQDTHASQPQPSESDRSEGPQCVVCQCLPRSIIAWPCRCLCICEDCRVSLAMNNFASCVTCRREVHGFVRLWIP